MRTRAEGLAVAAGLEAQQQAVGKDQTAIINAVKALAAGTQRFMPENLALTIGGEGGVNLSGLTPLLMQFLQRSGGVSAPRSEEHRPPVSAPPRDEPAGNSDRMLS